MFLLFSSVPSFSPVPSLFDKHHYNASSTEYARQNEEDINLSRQLISSLMMLNHVHGTVPSFLKLWGNPKLFRWSVPSFLFDFAFSSLFLFCEAVLFSFLFVSIYYHLLFKLSSSSLNYFLLFINFQFVCNYSVFSNKGLLFPSHTCIIMIKKK